ncbi:hypothetical protein KXD40_008035 [Peronospora effusa]|nr:hypothetical protein KXD40_008035 [Peronospora effusa]
MISIKKSLIVSAVAVALITTTGGVDGYDVVVSSKLTYNMKRTLRIAAEEVAEEEMADDSECEELEMAETDSECESLDMAEGDNTKTNNANQPPSAVSSGNTGDSSQKQTGETKDGGGDAKEKGVSGDDGEECDSLEMADTDSECNSLDMAEDSKGASSDPASAANNAGGAQSGGNNGGGQNGGGAAWGQNGGNNGGGQNGGNNGGGQNGGGAAWGQNGGNTGGGQNGGGAAWGQNGGNTGGGQNGGNNGGGQNGGEAGGNTWTPPSNTGGNAPTTSPGNTNPGNVNDNYNGMTSNIDFTAVQGEINPGTVVPQ